MKFTNALATTAVAGVLATSLIATAQPAGASTTPHILAAVQDWKTGARVSAAEQGRYWSAARQQLAFYGSRVAPEMADLATLIQIPETDTTAAQRATAARVTRDLNGFFRTPNLYGVAAGDPWAYARADWITSAHVAAATHNYWFAASVDELYSYHDRFAAQRAALVSLESIPLTNTTPQQRAIARRDVIGLDVFFHTPGLNY